MQQKSTDRNGVSCRKACQRAVVREAETTKFEEVEPTHQNKNDPSLRRTPNPNPREVCKWFKDESVTVCGRLVEKRKGRSRKYLRKQQVPVIKKGRSHDDYAPRFHQLSLQAPPLLKG